jgi:hypothetical protein
VNLRGVANRLTSAVNPNVPATLYVSAGYVTDAAGRQTPAYQPPETLTIQAQSLSKRELEYLAQMSISNATRSVFANRLLTGADRAAQSGGDLLDMADGRWLVTATLEDWMLTSGWCKVAVTRQLDTLGPLRPVAGSPFWSVEQWQADRNDGTV